MSPAAATRATALAERCSPGRASHDQGAAAGEKTQMVCARLVVDECCAAVQLVSTRPRARQLGSCCCWRVIDANAGALAFIWGTIQRLCCTKQALLGPVVSCVPPGCWRLTGRRMESCVTCVFGGAHVPSHASGAEDYVLSATTASPPTTSQPAASWRAAAVPPPVRRSTMSRHPPQL